jgi:hypothetical protein
MKTMMKMTSATDRRQNVGASFIMPYSQRRRTLRSNCLQALNLQDQTTHQDRQYGWYVMLITCRMSFSNTEISPGIRSNRSSWSFSRQCLPISQRPHRGSRKDLRDESLRHCNRPYQHTTTPLRRPRSTDSRGCIQKDA